MRDYCPTSLIEGNAVKNSGFLYEQVSRARVVRAGDRRWSAVRSLAKEEAVKRHINSR